MQYKWQKDDVDDAAINIRNVYATKMLLLFYPFHEHHYFLRFKIDGFFFVKLMKKISVLGFNKENAEYSIC
jgi:hypothetical protein